MPIKLKPSAKIRDRATGKITTEHYYLKCMTTKELNDYMNHLVLRKRSYKNVRMK